MEKENSNTYLDETFEKFLNDSNPKSFKMMLKNTSDLLILLLKELKLSVKNTKNGEFFEENSHIFDIFYKFSPSLFKLLSIQMRLCETNFKNIKSEQLTDIDDIFNESDADDIISFLVNRYNEKGDK